MYDKHFLIYADTGVSSDCIAQWTHFFKSADISHTLCTALDVIQGALNKADCFIMPGGADMAYCEKLNGAGNDAIKSYVENGGLYFGVCAGAYYAHRDIDWQNTTESITGARELSFFDGTATGPIIKPYNPNTNAGQDLVNLKYKGRTASLYYKGGPVMAVDNGTQVLATFIYEGVQYPALIKKMVGVGLAYAMSPHMEYGDDYLNRLGVSPCENRADIFLDIMENLFF